MAARNLLPDSNVFDREGRTKVYRSSPGVSPAPRKMCPPTPQARRNTRSCSGSSSRGSCATSWQDGDEDEPDVRPLWHTDGLLQDAFPWSSRSFTLLELTGEGDFGQVYKAVCNRTGKVYALKRSRLHPSQNQIAKHVSQLELLDICMEDTPHNSPVRKYGPLRCPRGAKMHLLRHYGLWEEDGYLYWLMEFCGGTLQSVHDAFDLFPEADIWQLLKDMSTALTKLHSKGLVHMDIKPENILINAVVAASDDDIMNVQRRGSKQQTGEAPMSGDILNSPAPTRARRQQPHAASSKLPPQTPRRLRESSARSAPVWMGGGQQMPQPQPQPQPQSLQQDMAKLALESEPWPVFQLDGLRGASRSSSPQSAVSPQSPQSPQSPPSRMSSAVASPAGYVADVSEGMRRSYVLADFGSMILLEPLTSPLRPSSPAFCDVSVPDVDLYGSSEKDIDEQDISNSSATAGQSVLTPIRPAPRLASSQASSPSVHRYDDSETDCQYMAAECLGLLPSSTLDAPTFAPPGAKARAVQPREPADIFALGLVLLTLITDEVLPKRGDRWRELRGLPPAPRSRTGSDAASVLDTPQTKGSALSDASSSPRRRLSMDTMSSCGSPPVWTDSLSSPLSDCRNSFRDSSRDSSIDTPSAERLLFDQVRFPVSERLKKIVAEMTSPDPRNRPGAAELLDICRREEVSGNIPGFGSRMSDRTRSKQRKSKLANRSEQVARMLQMVASPEGGQGGQKLTPPHMQSPPMPQSFNARSIVGPSPKRGLPLGISPASGVKKQRRDGRQGSELSAPMPATCRPPLYPVSSPIVVQSSHSSPPNARKRRAAERLTPSSFGRKPRRSLLSGTITGACSPGSSPDRPTVQRGFREPLKSLPMSLLGSGALDHSPPRSARSPRSPPNRAALSPLLHQHLQERRELLPDDLLWMASPVPRD